MKYAVYDAQGLILKVGTAPAELLPFLEDTEPGSIMVLADDQVCDDTTFYVDTTTKALAAYPPKPSDYVQWDWPTMSWVPWPEYADRDARARRQALLQDSDWTDTASAPARLGQALYDAWQTYRQALRDVPSQPGYPMNIVWPTPPQ